MHMRERYKKFLQLANRERSLPFEGSQATKLRRQMVSELTDLITVKSYFSDDQLQKLANICSGIGSRYSSLSRRRNRFLICRDIFQEFIPRRQRSLKYQLEKNRQRAEKLKKGPVFMLRAPWTDRWDEVTRDQYMFASLCCSAVTSTDISYYLKQAPAPKSFRCTYCEGKLVNP